ncbi:unnamed protein product [Pedinophyceae sp. YPF-701]|nr:unnamed protein product [Pedinophyceae sp. YPF-701]
MALLDLPKDVLEHISARLAPEDHAKLACTCKQLCTIAFDPVRWRAAAVEPRPAGAHADRPGPWRFWSPRLHRLARRGNWLAFYGLRAQRHARAQRAIADLTWPATGSDARWALRELGEDALDALLAEARRCGPENIGRRHRATEALQCVACALCVREAARSEDGSDDEGEGGADALPAWWTGPKPAPAPPCTYVPNLRVGAAESREISPEGAAMVLARVLDPLADLVQLQGQLEDLGEELKQRLHTAGARPGSRAALDELIGLLFGAPDAEGPWGALAEVADASARVEHGGESATHPSRRYSLEDVGVPLDAVDSLSRRSGWMATMLRGIPPFGGADIASDGAAQLDSVLTRPVPPWKEHGIGLRAAGVDYYSLRNSLLHEAFETQRGIPITLAVAFHAVGTRAGMPVRCIGMPRHFLASFVYEDGETLYVDCYNGGQIISSDEMPQWTQQFAGAALRPEFLAPVGGGAVLERMCNNARAALTAIDAASTTPTRCLLASLLSLAEVQMHAVAAMGWAPPGRDAVASVISRGSDMLVDARRVQYILRGYTEALRPRVDAPGPGEPGGAPGTGGAFAVGGGPGMAPNLPPEAFRQTQELFELVSESAFTRSRGFENGMRKARRERSTEGARQVRYRVGTVMRHARYGYRGVITGWDERCEASRDWIRGMGVGQLQRGESQPFYHVLVDVRDRPGPQSTYVAEDNVSVAQSWARVPLVLHPDVGAYFEGLEEGSAAYAPAEALRSEYPDDVVE